MRTVKVSLDKHSYPIRIGDGLLNQLGPRCAQLKLGQRCAVITDETVAGRPDTVDWSIGASYATHGFDLSLVYANTDLTTAECAAGCDGEVIIGISRSF